MSLHPREIDGSNLCFKGRVAIEKQFEQEFGGGDMIVAVENLETGSGTIRLKARDNGMTAFRSGLASCETRIPGAN
jgi:hypothetical protein